MTHQRSSSVPTILQTVAAEFRDSLLRGTPYTTEHDCNDHSRMLSAVARATELGIILLQRYPPSLLEQCIADMEHKMAEMTHPPDQCQMAGDNCYHCATCGERVCWSHCVQHVQLHAGAAFMSSIFPAYDPDKPHM